MLYITLKEDNKNTFYENIKDIIFRYKTENYNNHTLIILKKINTKSLKKLSKYFKTNCTSLVCLSENLRSNKRFLEFIQKENVKYFDGNWLFKFAVVNSVEYIVNSKKEKMEYQEISILANQLTENVIDTIFVLAAKCRLISIVTNNEKQFSKIEKELYERKGIILNINNNYSKSLKKSNIIINYDFKEEDINKYAINKNACILNLNDNIKILSKSFEGINAISFNINLPTKYSLGVWQNDFDNTILYESFIYKKTQLKNIKEEIKNDKMIIESLNGMKGAIRKREYLKISKKM